MRILSRVIQLGLLLSVAGCATLSPQSGHGEPGSTGQVVYNPEGVADLVEKRRSAALKKIKEFCNSGNYKVTSEQRVSKEALDGDDISTAGATYVQEIKFRCL